MTNDQKIEYINANNHRMTNEQIGVKLGIKPSSVQYYVRMDKRSRGVQLQVKANPNKRVFEFETNGNFDVDKWALCSHV